MRHLEAWSPLNLALWPSAEAQVASLADDVAYLSHDVDDGLRAGLISFAMLFDVPLAGPIAREVEAIGQGAEAGRAIYEVTRRMITAMVADIVVESRRRLQEIAPVRPDDIRQAGRAAVSFSEGMSTDLARLKAFLFQAVYHNRRVLGVMEKAEQVVRALFAKYLTDAETLPVGWREMLPGLDDRRRARLACDFLAGQTDRYALAEHRRLFCDDAGIRLSADILPLPISTPRNDGEREFKAIRTPMNIFAEVEARTRTALESLKSEGILPADLALPAFDAEPPRDAMSWRRRRQRRDGPREGRENEAARYSGGL